MQYSRMRHFVEIEIFWKYQMTDYFAHFHERFILKKSIVFVKFKKKMLYVHMNFPGFAKKFVCASGATYNFLRISALISGIIFVENIFEQISNCIFFFTFSLKNIVKEWITFTKLRKQNVVCAHKISWFTKKVVCTKYVILWCFNSRVKW